MDLGLRRVLLAVLSIVGGVAGLFGIIGVLNLLWNANVTLERYGGVYAVVTALPIALLCAVWLDYFLQTNLLPGERGRDGK